MTKRRQITQVEHVDAEFGPAMQALNEKQRLFVRFLFESPRKRGAAVFSARSSGYGSPTSSPSSMASIAHRLCSDPKVQAAIQEQSLKYVTTLGPLAVRALKNLVGKPAHRDHGRALGMIMDRVTPVRSTAVVKVEGEVKLTTANSTQVLQRIEELSRKFLVSLPAPKVIDHEATTT